MNITDDKLVFNDSDILQFTPGAQKALGFYTGPNMPPETAVINAFNQAVQSALDALTNDRIAGLQPLVKALAIADTTTQDQAQALIDQAKTVLGVPLVIPPALSSAPEGKASAGIGASPARAFFKKLFGGMFSFLN